MLTLWDLIEPIFKRRSKERGLSEASTTRPDASAGHTEDARGVSSRIESAMMSPRRVTATEHRTALATPARESAQAKYDRVVADQLAKYDIRVRKWRTSMSGIAWYVTYKDGRVSRLIEAPKPKGPMSMAVFLHEVGHHAIGFNVYKPRCLEEYHAWAWTLARMEEFGLNITDAVRYRMHLSLWYAVAKAKRRGIKSVPAELVPYLERPVKEKKGIGNRE